MTRCEKDALVVTVFPIDQAAITALEGDSAPEGIETPNRCTRSRIQSENTELGTRGIENTADNDGVALHLRAVEHVAGVVGPGDCELPDIAAVDLVKGRVTQVLPPTAVRFPTSIAGFRNGPLLFAGACEGQQDKQACRGAHTAHAASSLAQAWRRYCRSSEDPNPSVSDKTNRALPGSPRDPQLSDPFRPKQQLAMRIDDPPSTRPRTRAKPNQSPERKRRADSLLHFGRSDSGSAPDQRADTTRRAQRAPARARRGLRLLTLLSAGRCWRRLVLPGWASPAVNQKPRRRPAETSYRRTWAGSCAPILAMP